MLQMWDPCSDLGREGKDFPCNLSAHFQIRPGGLDMTVFNRSNDVVWGAYGANAVHFSMLQEYVASMTGVGVGKYYQVSDNFHVYTDLMDKKCRWDLASRTVDQVSYYSSNPYEDPAIFPYPMIDQPDDWDIDLCAFIRLGEKCLGYRNKFFRRVAVPMLRSWEAYKDGDKALALEQLENCFATDWRLACQQWISRRLNA